MNPLMKRTVKKKMKKMKKMKKNIDRGKSGKLFRALLKTSLKCPALPVE